MRGADILAKCLKQDGQEVVFALSGNQIMPIFDAFFDQDIKIIHTRHEAATGYMAEGYAQVSGKVGVALVTAGSGLGNAISPLMTAMASQTPLLLISGDSPQSLDGHGAFQEMDQVGLTQSVTKESIRVTDTNMISKEIGRALSLAKSGTPGPVHVSVPVDILEEDGEFEPYNQPDNHTTHASEEIISAIKNSARPLVITGPCLTSLRTGYVVPEDAPAIVAMESPRGANDPALGRFKECWYEADLVVALEKPIDFSVAFGREEYWPAARWITVHGSTHESERAQKNIGNRLIRSEKYGSKDILQSLLTIEHSNQEQRDWKKRVDALCQVKPDNLCNSRTLDSHSLCHDAQLVIMNSNNPIVVCDGGEFGQWGQAVVRSPRRIINGVAGAIGGGICYAIGAKLASPQSDVFLLMGDGTAGFHFSEFETAAREEIAFTAIIGNDRRWNAEHQIQLKHFGADRAHRCSLSPARYEEAAKWLGGIGVYVTAADKLKDGLLEARNSNKPACVNVEIQGLPAPSYQT